MDIITELSNAASVVTTMDWSLSTGLADNLPINNKKQTKNVFIVLFAEAL